jgi:hypothetical protein
MVIIPINQQTAWDEFSSELDGVMLAFTFRFNDRDGCWYFDLADALGNALASGLKAVTGVFLLEAVRGLPGMPSGDLFMLDTAGLSEDPTFDSLGRRHKLLYFTAAEMLSNFGI